MHMSTPKFKLAHSGSGRSKAEGLVNVQRTRFKVKLTWRSTVDAEAVARNPLTDGQHGSEISAGGLFGLAALDALQALEDLLLDGRYPLVALLGIGSLKVPLLESSDTM